MEIFFIAATLAYVALHFYLNAGLTRSISLKNSVSEKLPSVTVIVAARNEESRIAACIESLAAIDYPKELLEIILVNDRSQDKTAEIMNSLSSKNEAIRVINSRPVEQSNLKGKANAIDTAIELSKGEIIMTTDADCTVQPSWVKCTAQYFREDTAMVCGFTLIKREGSLFAKLQCADWLYLLTLASGSCGLRKTMSCIGNNLSFTREAYSRVGGYSAIRFSVTEDLALMRMTGKLSDRKILYPVNESALVMTEPCADIAELASQKRRWFRGGTGINFLGYVTGIALYTSSFLIMCGYFFIDIRLWLLLSAVIMLAQVFIMTRPAMIFRHTGLLGIVPLFTVYLSVYGLLLPFSFLFGKGISWKGRKF